MGIFNAEKPNLCKQGIRGLPGLSIQGNKGDTGQKGDKGDKGNNGNNGQKGDKGDSLDITQGFVMRADIDMNDKRIFNLSSNPITDDDAISKRFVDNYKFRSDELLRVDGSNMLISKLNANNQVIGPIADAINQWDCTHKYYVDELDLKNMKFNEVRKMQVYLDMNNFHIYNLKSPNGEDHATNKQYVDTTLTRAVVNFVDRRGDVFYGDLDMRRNKLFGLRSRPQTDDEAVCKEYVDLKTVLSQDLMQNTGARMSGTLDMDDNQITNLPMPLADYEPATKKYVDDCQPIVQIPKNLMKTTVVNVMQKNIDMNKNKLINLKETPEKDTDVICKKYVDQQALQYHINDLIDPHSPNIPPFNGGSNLSGLYFTRTNNQINYGVSPLPVFVGINYFEYFPGGNEKKLINNQKVNFINFTRDNNDRILSGNGINITPNIKNKVHLKAHIIHRITASMFFEHTIQDVEYSIKISQDSGSQFYGFNGHSKFHMAALCIFGDIIDRDVSIVTINATSTVRLEHIRVKIDAVGSYRPGYFGKF